MADLLFATQWDGTPTDAARIVDALKGIGITAHFRRKYTTGYTQDKRRSIFEDEPVIIITTPNGPVLAHAGQVIEIPKKETN